MSATGPVTADSFPKHVTPAQQQAAAEALGLPAHSISAFTADACEGVTVTFFERNELGRIKVEHGEPVIGVVRIPIDRSTP